MNKSQNAGRLPGVVMQAGRLAWALVLVIFILTAVWGHSLYTVVLGAHSWSDELQESGMPAAAAAYARAYIWELAELDRLEELGRLGAPLERHLERVIADYISDQWMAGQLDRLQAGVWDVIEGKRETLPPLDVSELKDKLTAEVTRVIPYHMLQSLGWELAVPERVDMMTVLGLDRAELAEWRAAYARAEQIVKWLTAMSIVWLATGFALHERPHVSLGWIGGGLLAAALAMVALQAGAERGSTELIRQTLAGALATEPAAGMQPLFHSAAYIAEKWLRETVVLAEAWAWRIAAAGIAALLLGWIGRLLRSRSTAEGMRLPGSLRFSLLALGFLFAGVAIAAIL
ncbi:hypothetical protein DUZ99_12770 [Xylanibacillus composti]|uniref:Uncharacterized protein n=1 Tax=Xylanibacillus composti TaxID=1572762 RepID=A0A8J4M2K1_9BACL|nr:hypothetical protein [Xylanibacillus composti]MDT9725845.1 hypothetical protein [Xylanibacillus composti]GIQ69200.1 hypothetical protein XYCOK13_20240 [Xylanibacillus composti]